MLQLVAPLISGDYGKNPNQISCFDFGKIDIVLLDLGSIFGVRDASILSKMILNFV